VANTAPVPKGTNKVLSREIGTEARCSAKYLRSKAKSKAPQRAKSKVTMTLLPKFSGAKLASCGGATRLTSLSEVNITYKVIFKSPKNRNLKARGLQPEQPLQVSKQDRVSLVNTDLREFLTNKRKLELLHTHYCCEQVGCQLVIELEPAQKYEISELKNRDVQVLNSTVIASGYASRDPQGGTSDKSFLVSPLLSYN